LPVQGDGELERSAIRIRDPAIRRAGELLLQQRAGKNRFDRGSHGQPSNRKQGANAAGLSSQQAHMMKAVARVPLEQFEAGGVKHCS
jgi:hypothetical protein